MRQVNIHEAKTTLSQLLVDVEGGEEIVIARYGQPVAKLVPIGVTIRARQPGSARGRFTVPRDLLRAERTERPEAVGAPDGDFAR